MKNFFLSKKNFIDRWNNIMYMWCNGLLKTLPDSFTDNISPKSPLKKIKLMLKNITTDFLRLFKKSQIPNSKIWFIVFSQNNLDALKGIKENTPSSIYVSFFRFRSSINEKNTHYFYYRFKFLHDLFYPIFWIIYSLEHSKKAFLYYDLLLTVHGSYEESLRLLKKHKPKAIVFTNDHLVIARALLLAANDLGIKTYYVQHASVSEHFPPLEFSHAFLEGNDALSKYQKCGEVKSEVHLIGMPKFDNFANKLNNKNKISTLGVAFNFIDRIDEVYNFLLKLKRENPRLKLIVRPHPGDTRNMELFQEFNISDSKKESAFEFLTTIDCLISGDSSIHLEAVLLNVYPMHYNFSKTMRFDFYGYIKNNLVEYYSNINTLNNKLKELQLLKPNIRYKAVYYNAAIESDFYGKSIEKIVSIIEKTINN